jgi:hypothetical protein
MQMFALPIGGAVCAVVALFWLHATPVTKNPDINLAAILISLVLLLPIHELLHAVVHPKFGTSRHTFIGVWPSRLVCYAFYDGVLSRNRLIATLGMPLLVITFLPLAAGMVFGHASVTVAYISSLNALAAGGDIYGICLLLWQVPRRANVFNEGWRTYWSAGIVAQSPR